MTDTSPKRVCIACGHDIEDHDKISAVLCDDCYRQVGRDLEEMDSDSTGFK